MVRADRQNPDVYFGRPGALLQLPWPRGGVDRSYERQTYDFLTGSGNHAVSSLSSASRPYALSWRALHVDNFIKLDQFRTGTNGPGPWVFIDPSAPNLLPTNVSGATGHYANATDFESLGGTSGTVSSNSDPALIHRATGYRSIRWQFLSTPITSPRLGVVPQYRNWPGHPVAPSIPYTFSSWMRADGVVDSSITAAMTLEWYTSANVLIGSAATSGALTITASWQRVSVTSTAPVNAAYVRPVWVATGASITLNASLYIDEPILEQDTVVNDWAPGTGIRPVEIVSLTEPVTFATRFRESIQMVLREVAR